MDGVLGNEWDARFLDKLSRRVGKEDAVASRNPKASAAPIPTDDDEWGDASFLEEIFCAVESISPPRELLQRPPPPATSDKSGLAMGPDVGRGFPHSTLPSQRPAHGGREGQLCDRRGVGHGRRLCSKAFSVVKRPNKHRCAFAAPAGLPFSRRALKMLSGESCANSASSESRSTEPTLHEVLSATVTRFIAERLVRIKSAWEKDSEKGLWDPMDCKVLKQLSDMLKDRSGNGGLCMEGLQINVANITAQVKKLEDAIEAGEDVELPNKDILLKLIDCVPKMNTRSVTPKSQDTRLKDGTCSSSLRRADKGVLRDASVDEPFGKSRTIPSRVSHKGRTPSYPSLIDELKEAGFTVNDKVYMTAVEVLNNDNYRYAYSLENSIDSKITFLLNLCVQACNGHDEVEAEEN